eukprot:gnl/MRDRNA2_/MRDRNA2_35117_c0_seq1.p1 gnl/MRDRNA2_/MRDRNA2_35117_c0~~gnl/MRDRNA2_/MRDRNA2_35117_c0_seq1.p1  ORF type:complete len:574 (-),score=86.13 gnl/MRDRNA2_/MRDRNA2_35117_c0_seq1:44-1645(-)
MADAGIRSPHLQETPNHVNHVGSHQPIHSTSPHHITPHQATGTASQDSFLAGTVPASSIRPQSWQCSLCRLTNDDNRLQCQLCGAPPPSGGSESSNYKKETELDFNSESVKREAMRTRQMHAEVQRLGSLVEGGDARHMNGTPGIQGSGATCTQCSELLYETNVVFDALCALTSDVLRAGLPGGAGNQEAIRVGLRGLIGQVLETFNNSPKPELFFKDERLRLTHGMLEDFFSEIGGTQSSITRRPPQQDSTGIEGQHSHPRVNPSIQGFELARDTATAPQMQAMLEQGGAQSSSGQSRLVQDSALTDPHHLSNATKFPELNFGSSSGFATSPNKSSQDVFSWWTSDPDTLAAQRRHASHLSVEGDLGDSISEAVQWSWWFEDEAHRRATRDPISPGLQEARSVKEWMSEFEGTNPYDFSRLQIAHQFLRSTLDETQIKNLKRRPITGRRGTEPFLLPTEDKVEHSSYMDAEAERRRLMNNATRLPETLQDAADKATSEDTRPCGPTPWLISVDPPKPSGTGFLDAPADFYDH